MKRTIIKIDENICNGCGNCVLGCHEGALQMIDGKARLISDLFCDGLGACIGECPVEAITLEEREAEPYDEIKVMEKMIEKGENTIIAHLKHLKQHNEHVYFEQGIEYLKEKNIKINFEKMNHESNKKEEGCGCLGSAPQHFTKSEKSNCENNNTIESELTHWPIQMHLINPNAEYFKNCDLLLAADCTAFCVGSFHPNLLKGKSLIIACPKLDSKTENYIQKITSLVNDAKINTLTIAIMEVPCCLGLIELAKTALNNATRKIPIKKIVVGIKGEILSEEWI